MTWGNIYTGKIWPWTDMAVEGFWQEGCKYWQDMRWMDISNDFGKKEVNLLVVLGSPGTGRTVTDWQSFTF